MPPPSRARREPMSRLDDAAPEFLRRYEGSTETVNGARLDADRWLTDQGADDDTRQRAALVVSELASNAVQASPGRRFEVRLRRGGDVVHIVVTNRAEHAVVPERDEWGPDDVLAPTGRGLAIVDALSRSVEIEMSGDGDVTVDAAITAGFVATD